MRYLIILLLLCSFAFATDTVYVDGTLSTGSNDGTSWANAYQGWAGLQTACDNVTNTNDTDIYIRNTFTVDVTLDIDAASGDITNNCWVDVIGCDANGNELTLGNYVSIDATDTDMAGTPVFNTAGEIQDWRFFHLEIQNDIAPASGEDGFRGTGWEEFELCSNFLFYNCYFHNCYNGIFSPNAYDLDNVNIINCIFVVSNKAVGIDYSTACIINSYIETTSASVPAASFRNYITHSIIVGGSSSLDINESTIINKCTIYNAADNGILKNDGKSILIMSSLVWNPSPTADNTLYLSDGGCIYENFNLTNRTVDSNSFSGINSITGSDLEDPNDPNTIFIDAANGDFRIRMNARNVINQGLPPLSTDSMNKVGNTTIGCWQPYANTEPARRRTDKKNIFFIGNN